MEWVNKVISELKVKNEETVKYKITEKRHLNCHLFLYRSHNTYFQTFIFDENLLSLGSNDK